MARVFNFSAGPAVLPLEVLQEVQTEMLDFAGVPEEERGLCDRCRKYDESHKFLKGDKIR